MGKYILARKCGMTSLIDDEGVAVPVTVLTSDGCRVLRVMAEKPGQNRLLVGFESISEKKLNRPAAGVFKSLSSAPFRVLKEIKISDLPEVGDDLGVSVFEVGNKVQVRGRSIGKGFAGTVKRWNFARGPMSHGSKSHRIPGSIGGGTTPGKVVKGKKMPGHLGNEFVTVTNLVVVKVDADKGLLYVRGAVPGKPGGLVEVFSKVLK